MWNPGRWILRKVITLAAILALVGCAADKLPFPLDENGDFENPKQEDVCRVRKQLSGFELNPTAFGRSQGVIFISGVLLEAEYVQNEKQSLSVLVDKTMLNETGITVPSRISVTSPVEKLGGLPVAIGERYRLAVFPINGKFYSWATLGSAPYDPKLSGFYRCP